MITELAHRQCLLRWGDAYFCVETPTEHRNRVHCLIDLDYYGRMQGSRIALNGVKIISLLAEGGGARVSLLTQIGALQTPGPLPNACVQVGSPGEWVTGLTPRWA